MTKTASHYKPAETIPFPNDIRFHSDLTFGERIFLAEIHSMTKSCNGRYPFSCKNLAALFGVSHQTIANWVRKLVKMGLVDVAMDYTNEESKQFLITK